MFWCWSQRRTFLLFHLEPTARGYPFDFVIQSLKFYKVSSREVVLSAFLHKSKRVLNLSSRECLLRRKRVLLKTKSRLSGQLRILKELVLSKKIFSVHLVEQRKVLQIVRDRTNRIVLSQYFR